MEIETQILADLILVYKFTPNRIVPNSFDRHFFGEFCLFFVVNPKIEKCFLPNIDIMHAGNGESNAAA